MRSFILFTAFAASSSATTITKRAMSCHDVYIPVTAEALNKDLASSLTIADLTGPFLNQVASSGASTLTGGKYKIHGRYCEPEKTVKSRRNTVQVLVHGITYTVDYWSGLAPPGTKPGQDKYSWIDYASQQGYPTLSIERLCNGKSSRPNGISACQVPLQAEAMHGVVQAARAGQIPGVKRKFSRVIYVGHSYGSLVGNGLTVQHPDDVDAFIATGYSQKLARGASGVIVRPLFLPAKVVQPQVWGDLNDPSYIIATNLQGALDVFYFGKYKKQVSQYDYDHRQTVTYGEFATALLGTRHDAKFKGPVFVLNGNEDNIFCATPNSANLGNAGNCSNAYSSEVRKGYPNARAFGFKNVANTGHCLNNHLTAQESFKAAHDFLSKQGF